MKTIISIDGMGGERGLQAVLPGIQKAYNEIEDENLHFALFAPESEALPIIEKLQLNNFITLESVDSVVRDNDTPLKIFQKGSNTTMGKAIQAVADSKADAVISSGSTGGYIALCRKLMDFMPEINKIALPAFLPHPNGRSIMLDVGGVLVATEYDLLQFAIMGTILAKEILGIESPKVGILNVGTEEIKGLPHIINAHKFFKENPEIVSYHGFIEGTDLCKGIVDVIVTDGFSGNIALKAVEGTSVFLKQGIKKFLGGSWWQRFLSLGATFNLRQYQKSIDRRMYNGAVLLGLSKLAVKSHGDSDDVAFCSAIKVAYKAIKGELVNRISESLANGDHKECIKIHA